MTTGRSRNFFVEIGALNAHDRRFVLFCEGLLSGSVNPDEVAQREIADAMREPLFTAGLTIADSPGPSGYDDFHIVPTGLHRRPPQLVLFASDGGQKPDLRVKEVLDRELDIVNTYGALSYDRPIAIDTGLRWSDLETWWAERIGPSKDTPSRPYGAGC